MMGITVDTVIETQSERLWERVARTSDDEQRTSKQGKWQLSAKRNTTKQHKIQFHIAIVKRNNNHHKRIICGHSLRKMRKPLPNRKPY